MRRSVITVLLAFAAIFARHAPAGGQPPPTPAPPYRGIEIPRFMGWSDPRLDASNPPEIVYDLRNRDMEAKATLRARPAAVGDKAKIAAMLREAERSPVPPGHTRKIHRFSSGFAVVFTGPRDMQARAVMLVRDGRGVSYVTALASWSKDSDLRMGIVALRFLGFVRNR